MQFQFPSHTIFPKVAYLPFVTTREYLSNIMPAVGRYVSDTSISNSLRAIKGLSRTINGVAMFATTPVVKYKERRERKKRNLLHLKCIDQLTNQDLLIDL